MNRVVLKVDVDTCLGTQRGVPALLDLFVGIAGELYEQYGGREDEQLHDELAQFVQRYFTSELNTLVN